MTTCTYSFTGADGNPTVITGKAAFKAYLLDGGLQQLLPSIQRSERVPQLNPEDVLTPETMAKAEAAYLAVYSASLSLPSTRGATRASSVCNESFTQTVLRSR